MITHHSASKITVGCRIISNPPGPLKPGRIPEHEPSGFRSHRRHRSISDVALPNFTTTPGIMRGGSERGCCCLGADLLTVRGAPA